MRCFPFASAKFVAFSFWLPLLVGCTTPFDRRLEGNAFVSLHVACTDFTKVSATATRAMADEGYRPIHGGNPQELRYAGERELPLQRMLAYVRGGNDQIWIVAQPTARGWTLFALPEPDGVDTGFPRWRVRRVLEAVRQACESERLLPDLPS